MTTLDEALMNALGTADFWRGVATDEWSRAFLAALRADGWTLAPLKPTGAMIDAGARTYGVCTPAIGSLPLSVIDGQPSKAYCAMLEAAKENGDE